MNNSQRTEFRAHPDGKGWEACELGKELVPEQMESLARWLYDPEVPEEAKMSFLSRWACRGETPKEMAALARELLRDSLPLPIRGFWEGRPIVDTCGTGGGGLCLFNVSTAAMFVCAAAGLVVVKHGNRAVTKRCGSADVLEALGLPVELEPDELVRSLQEIGMGFVYAPKYHPVLARLSGLRRRMGLVGQRSVFHMLGPLLNPARPAVQLVGVFAPEHVTKMVGALRELGCQQAVAVYGIDQEGVGLGEMGTNGEGVLAGLPWEKVALAIKSWAQRRAYHGSAKEVLVSHPEQSARMIEEIFCARQKGFARGLVVVNSALVLLAARQCQSFEEGAEQVEEILDRGLARKKLEDARRFYASVRRSAKNSLELST
ncbi:anthranilate phosphoribosyltransferase [Candidatus Methylacidithermus pantelleriae]|uniref:Anthranilate phosphoribosyltransferase n=1 Tax=Candidatus Methylacidithermus pantelleriae TaxID=2744239 RepID=A0A8J2FUT5_9BACT|nr:anthranilate phosphoribosyltransferase [Candidatus Methylacidithermus pantelleriae]CAF0704561.1 Anthranilate phosphoribosyltransferase [Candidatus Methylacidithermus pantelleriae]